VITSCLSYQLKKVLRLIMEKPANFKGKVALVTGAGSGIGAATAILFYKLGATISITDINEDGLKKTLDACLQIASDSPKPLLTIGDIGDEIFQKSYIDSTIEKLAQIDILVNNAGIAPKDSINNGNLAVFDRVISINLRAPYNLTVLATPYLRKTRGCIVNMSSCATQKTIEENMLTYSLSKMAINKLTTMAAAELGRDGIRVNSVNPGPTLTEIYKQQAPNGNVDDMCKKFAALTTVNRIGQPEDIANAVCYLSSDCATFISGINMLVDGGWSIKRN